MKALNDKITVNINEKLSKSKDQDMEIGKNTTKNKTLPVMDEVWV